MGLEEYDNSGGLFLKIRREGICLESKTEREGYRKIEGKLADGTEFKKWIKPFKAVSGYVTKIEWYDREYNGRKFRGWNLHIDADGVPCNLDIPFASRVNSRFMKLAENIDFRKPVRFSAWHDRKTDSTAFNVQQDGVTVPQAYTRENPGNCPEPIQRRNGEWDYGDQEDFLCERMINTVIPTVEVAASLRPMREVAKGGELKDDGDEPPKTEYPKTIPDDFEDDVPF